MWILILWLKLAPIFRILLHILWISILTALTISWLPFALPDFAVPAINMSSAYIQGLGANEVGARSILYDMTCSTYTTFILSETIKIAENIGSGHTIPGSLDYNPDPAFMFKQDGGYGYCYFNNVGEEDRESTFMPIKFYLDGQIHFGWIRYKSEQVVEDSQLFTRIYIEEYAYNLTADSSVVTAQIPVGLPSNTAYNIEPVIQTERNQLTINSSCICILTMCRSGI
jgi:hypothetical protein